MSAIAVIRLPFEILIATACLRETLTGILSYSPSLLLAKLKAGLL